MSTFNEWLFSLAPPKPKDVMRVQGAWIPEHKPEEPKSFVVEFTQEELDEINEDAKILAGKLIKK